ncbi:MAG: response regulator, partial [Pseudomonadota bacterium]
LTLTRYDERHEEIIKVVSLSAIAREVAGQFAVLGEKSIDFQVDIEEAVFIESTREGVITILTNLLSNAFKYTQQGQVSLTVSASGELANIEVTDTGKGIADAEKDKVFDTFYRVSSHANVEGSGVGLAIVKRLVDKYKGTIMLASRLGEGTSFKLAFKTAQFADQVPVDNTSLKSKVSHDKASVLIIEDNDELRHYLKTELQHRYQVLLAEDGQVGLQIALSQVPDLIITDLMMPKVDGFTVLDSLHNSPVTCHIPVIILTAKGDYETRVSSLQQHALDVITKPFDREELFLKVENWIQWVNLYSQQQILAVPEHVEDEQSIAVDPRDKQLLENLERYVAEHYQQQGFSMVNCAKELALSERQLQRKLKVLLNITPSEYLRNYRLSKAAELLRQGRQISLVIDDVGFSSRSYFSKFFKAKYGMTAKEYQCHYV